ncbi:MAG TPA: PorP/SprF family type IX secretion system membrane protein [Chryseosolibacter sp.]|nr:PorP/SprF family type IX secretion system membrane protein [Chryseosolibacter sp.]
MKKLLIFLFVIISGLVNAQNNGPFNRQFFFNPFTFNPAYGGIANQSELGLVYRKQWVNFQDAPTTAGLTLQLPASQRVVLGLSILSDKQVLMKNNSFMTSFIYVVPLGFQQSLRFGLSGGVGMNALNLSVEEMNTNDPVIMRASGNNFYLNGNFGAVYTHRGLTLGFALTEIFDSNPFSAAKFNKFSFSNLRNRLYSVSYRFELPTAPTIIALEPYILYRESEDGLQNFWEAATLIHFNETLWTGASYNQNNGLAMFLGFNVREKFSFSYSYEFPPLNTSNFSASSHELQLRLKFGRERSPVSKPALLLNKYQKKKNPNYKRPKSYRRPVKARVKKSEPVRSRVRAKAIDQVASPQSPLISETAADQSDNIQRAPEAVAPGTKSYYVVVGSVHDKVDADALIRQLSEDGNSADVVIDPESHLYQVFLFSSTDPEAARKFLSAYMEKNSSGKAWIFSKD